MRRNLLIIVLACGLLAAAAASLMSQSVSHVGSPRQRAPNGAGVHTAPPETSIPPSTPGTTCPCYTAASIQASLDTCANETTSCDPGVAGPTLTFRAVCVGPPLAILAKWAQLTDAGECSKTTPDPVTGESIVATETVNGTQRADCTAILVAKCP